ncbi:MAG: ComF family protein [Chitinophagaceae bacterium]|nr:ComF family protein [Chitinophagaceae bacterium]
MNLLTDIKESLFHLTFPHVCEGCGSDLLDKQNLLCLHCLSSLPQTNFHLHANNPIEKIFWGRIPVSNATAQYYFTKESLIQRLMHQFKYRGNKELGAFLGKLTGFALVESNRFQSIDYLVPLPLFASKEKLRGYNQAAVLCDGMSEVIKLPVLKDIVIRRQHTESQTKKSRIERWQNMEGRFELINERAITGKHILLVDDVVTTGATLEACGAELLKAQNVQLSIATLCFSSS